MLRTLRLLAATLLVSGLAGCVRTAPCCCTVAAAAPPPPTTARPAPVTALWRGDTGAATTLARFATDAEDADVVLFGELHGHPDVARAELELFRRLAAGKRPVALAMEFFERDTQGDVDRWLAGETDDAAFRKATKRPADYPTTHGPLLALAKQRGVPVIAANAPRRLVTAWRKGDLAYDAWRESLPEADRALVPRAWSAPKDAYWDRFAALMGPQRAEPFFRAQSLWDDAMAEAVADFREAHPDTRVLLVIGGFHVAHRGGTASKLLARRPKDRVLVLLAATDASGSLAFRPADRGSADVVLRVKPPPETKPAPKAAPSPPTATPKGTPAP